MCLSALLYAGSHYRATPEVSSEVPRRIESSSLPGNRARVNIIVGLQSFPEGRSGRTRTTLIISTKQLAKLQAALANWEACSSFAATMPGEVCGLLGMMGTATEPQHLRVTADDVTMRTRTSYPTSCQPKPRTSGYLGQIAKGMHAKSGRPALGRRGQF